MSRVENSKIRINFSSNNDCSLTIFRADWKAFLREIVAKNAEKEIIQSGKIKYNGEIKDFDSTNTISQIFSAFSVTDEEVKIDVLSSHAFKKRDFTFLNDNLTISRKKKESEEDLKESATFMFDVKPEAEDEEENFKLDLSLQLGQLEEEYLDLNGKKDIRKLSFIIPLTSNEIDSMDNVNTHIGDVNIPIPLRSYPTAPALMKQTADSSLDNATYYQKIEDGEPLSDVIKKAKSWDYDVIYEDKAAAQDRIVLSTDFNIKNTTKIVENSRLTKEQLYEELKQSTTGKLDDEEKEELFKNVISYLLNKSKYNDIYNLIGGDLIDEDLLKGQLEKIHLKSSLMNFIKDRPDEIDKIENFVAAGDQNAKREIVKGIVGNNLGSFKKFNEMISGEEFNKSILFDKLAEFNSIYPKLKEDLVKESEEIKSKYTAYSEMVQKISDIFKSENFEFSDVVINRASDDKGEYSIEIEKKPDDEVHCLKIREINGDHKNVTRICVKKRSSTGWSEMVEEAVEEGQKFLFPTGFKPFDEQVTYRFCFENNDSMFVQNAWSGIYVTRNDELDFEDVSSEIKINPDFVYRTPMVHFPNKMMPTLRRDENIDINEDDDLGSDLANFFNVLFTKDGSGEKEVKNKKIKLTAKYGYNISGLEDSLVTFLPILFIPEYVFEGDDAGKFAEEVAANLNEWKKTNGPALNNAYFYFDVCVYSNVNTEMVQPILELKNVRYKLK